MVRVIRAHHKYEKYSQLLSRKKGSRNRRNWFKGAWLSYWLSILGADVRATGYNSKNQKKKLFYVLSLHKKIKTYYLDKR